MTRDEVLLWLDERDGRTVQVAVEVNFDSPFYVDGVLMRASGLPGMYVVGEGGLLDLTRLKRVNARWIEAGTIELVLANGVCLKIGELPERPES